ncbi:ABC transporter ATP-binding protein [Facklamia lactis]|uniref:ABC transporter ATP-binding protein n=1 Tax=Facklamia lactis TaxID=2749967 RepID=UPI0018CD894B|nr:ABC transporter ATP-binding protein [Facklamia lactis]MBG9980931.1 ABC transporter ATP-binding protein [Facklamia lactis]
MKLIKNDRYLVAGMLLSILATFVAVIIPLILKSLIDKELTINIQNVILLIACFILQAILTGIGNYLIALHGEQSIVALRYKLNYHLIYMPQSYFDQQNSGELVSRIMNDSQQIRKFLTESLPNLVVGVLTIILSVCFLFTLDWKLTLSMLIIFPLMLTILIPMSKLSFKNSEKFQASMGSLTRHLTNMYRNTSFVKYATAEEQLLKEFETESQQNYEIAKSKYKVEAFTQPVGLGILFCSIAIIFGYGGYRVSIGAITIGTLMSFLIYTFQLLNPIGGLSQQISDYASMKGALTALEDIFHNPIEDFEKGCNFFSGDVHFKHVSFAYNDKNILKDISLTLPQGAQIAIVGPSGGGKSTIAKLLLGLYTVSEGTINIDDTNINQINLLKLRQSIAYISQDTYLIPGTIKDNLKLGLSHPVTDQEINRAIKLVGLEEDISNMTNGLDTEVGENGKLLSGGQKQRLSIAQALLRKSSIIIFDEATSNLDADNESIIIDLVNNVLKNITTITIAHRLSTVVNADEIIFLDNGTITGRGNHNDLFSNHADYRRYVEEQMINN